MRESRASEERNRRFWDADADAYQEVHGDALAERPLAWGAWRVPEEDVGALGGAAGLAGLAGGRVLELGCGAAQWSVGLARLGARAVGVDQSAGQLAHAARRVAAAGVDVALVLATATATPFPAASFDVVLADHGAPSFCDPARLVPEVARLLRPGGRFACCTSTPLHYWTYDYDRDRQTRTLHNSPFERRVWDTGEGTVDWCVPEGEWLRLFHAHGLVAEDLVLLRPAEGARTTYTDFVSSGWSRRWPSEHVWKVGKPNPGGRGGEHRVARGPTIARGVREGSGGGRNLPMRRRP